MKLTEEDIHIIQAYEGIHVRFMSLEGNEIVWDMKDAEQLKQQILSSLKLQELVKEMDIPTIIQFLKEYGFAICSTSECRYKVAEQHDKLIKLQSLMEECEKK